MVATIDKFKSLISAKGGMARPNLFRIKFPSLPGATSEEVNILCKDVQLPGRQIMTNERRIGLQMEKVPYGYAVGDVSATFHVLNNYGIKEYFETWQNLAVNQQTKEIGYQSEYARSVEIEQFQKVQKLPNRFRKEFDNSLLPRLSDVDIVQQFFNVGDQLNDLVVYRCKLIDAFPTSMTAIQLNNDLDGIVELNVQLSYTNWETPFVLSPSNVRDSIQSSIRSTLVGFVNNIV
tara:strand:- start:5603 stop:6304 length:702 start_codon:yes stop_codon:yes gene_type:complete